MGARAPERISEIAGFALGLAYMSVFATLGPVQSFFERRRPGAVADWLFLALGLVLVAVLVISPRIRRENPFLTLGVVGLFPTLIASFVGQHYGIHSHPARSIRALGLLVAFGAEFVTAVWFARQKKELDRQVFTESALFAFFVTVAAGVVYGVAQEWFDAPRLAFTWLALFGLTVFVASLFILERRYA